jgi:hypothetical protein
VATPKAEVADAMTEPTVGWVLSAGAKIHGLTLTLLNSSGLSEGTKDEDGKGKDGSETHFE